MLKSLRLGTALFAVFTTPISTSVLTSPARAASIGTLNAQLQHAICNQNWGGAVGIVDKIIAAVPSNQQTQRNRLGAFRVQMEKFRDSETALPPNWSEYCSASPNSVGSAATPSVASNGSNSSVCSPSLSGIAAPLCQLAELLVGSQKFQEATVGAKSAKPKEVASFGKLCKGVIPTFLKAPGTAKFPEDPMVAQVATGVYVINGKVDAQNDYGALIRGSYTCVFRNDSKTGIDLVTADVNTPH